VSNHSALSPRRRTVTTGAIAVLALGLAACSSSAGSTDTSASPTSDPKAPVTISWWTGQTAEAETLLEGLAKEYTTAHPNVTIKVSPGASTTDDLKQKIAAGFVADTYPDLSYAFGSWATELGNSGHTLDLAAKVADPAVKWEEIPEAARKTATVDGRVIGVPALVDNLGLLYNTKVFDDAGVAYPTNDWSWDDFRAAAKKLTDPSKQVFGTAFSVSGSEDTTWHFWPLLWQNGGQILSEDQKTATFNSDAGVKSLDLLRAMAVDDKSMYLDQTDEKYPQLMYDGKVAMIIGGPWLLYDLKDKKVAYGATQLPGTNGDHQTVSGPDVWVAFDHSDANRAAATTDFLLWLTSAEVDERWNLAYGNLPLRTSESTSPAFTTWAKDYAPGAEVFFANLANAKNARPTVEGYVEMSKYVGEAISKVMQGQSDSKTALDDAAAKSADALG
jgi:multiple sugar transport system substrate-binding protein